MSNSRRGFTVIELLITLFILSVIGMALVAALFLGGRAVYYHYYPPRPAIVVVPHHTYIPPPRVIVTHPSRPVGFRTVRTRPVPSTKVKTITTANGTQMKMEIHPDGTKTITRYDKTGVVKSVATRDRLGNEHIISGTRPATRATTPPLREQ